MFSKHVLGPLVILVRFLPVLLSMPQRGDLCPDFPITEDSKVVLHINTTTGETRCCKQILCPAGSEVQYCSKNNPNNTGCRPCRPGYYSPDNQLSHNNPKCLPWKQCNEKLGLVFNNDGDTLSEGTCSCNVAKGFYSDKWGDCQQAKDKCEPDHELDGKSGICERCRAGYEQLEEGFGPCNPCPPNTYKMSGQMECTKCPLGTFKPNEGYGECLTCEELHKKGYTEIGCDPTENSTPKIGASNEDNQSEGNPTVMIAVLTVLCLLALLLTLVFAAVYLHRRRKLAMTRRKKPSSPLHSANPASHNYRSVPDTSSNSSDTTSHSSAEDALEAEKIKAQNSVNQKATVLNEKTGVPLDEINTDAPPAGQGQPQGQPQGHPQGQPQGHPPGYGQGQFGKPHDRGFLIVNPTNCNISFGDSNQLHNTPVASIPTEAQLNDLNSPPGVPVVNLNNNQGTPSEGDSAYVNKAAPEYYDEADRIAAYYNGPSEC